MALQIVANHSTHLWEVRWAPQSRTSGTVAPQWHCKGIFHNYLQKQWNSMFSASRSLFCIKYRLKWSRDMLECFVRYNNEFLRGKLTFWPLKHAFSLKSAKNDHFLWWKLQFAAHVCSRKRPHIAHTCYYMFFSTPVSRIESKTVVVRPHRALNGQTENQLKISVRAYWAVLRTKLVVKTCNTC